MTKEELKLEAIKYLENFKDCANCKNRWCDCADQLDEYCLENGCCFATPKEQDIYLAGAEPREKHIAELSKHIVELQNDKGELIDRCRELEAQIEKMKNCKNCANYMISGKCPCLFKTGWCKNWELAK